MLFLTSKEDSQRFDSIFTNRISFSKSIHGDVKEWVCNNIQRWTSEKPPWFVMESIPDEFLPDDVFEAEGGNNRRRSNGVSVRELIGIDGGLKVYPEE